PFRNRRFCWLFVVLLVNGIAASIPATLFLFFVKDQLHLASYAGLFLALYFIAAAASMPLWVTLAQHFGEARAWLVAMVLSALVFIWAYGVASGAGLMFGAICILSGLTLGADLALPPALLAGVIASVGHSGQREGAYFGAWSWATKMNLALAAGISLPLLEWLGYVPGTVNASGTHALVVGYALLPCLLKLIAATILWCAPLRDL
ncbi:MAG: MFS transporter, partial [Burkholderiaceae bacterium]